MIKRYGIIELGTRGIRLLVADASPTKIEEVIFSTGDLSNLGKEADNNGNLSVKSIKNVTNIASKYVEMAKSKGATDITAIATEVVRVAPNRDLLLQSLLPVIPLKILRNQEEAVFSFLASADAFKESLFPGSTLLVIDQGGGSTELTTGTVTKNGLTLQGIESFDLGTVMLSRLFVEAPTLPNGFDRIKKTVRAELGSVQPFRSLLIRPPTLTVGLGSAIMIFMRGIMAQPGGYVPSLRSLHGNSVRTDIITERIIQIRDRLTSNKRSDFAEELIVDSELTTLVSGILTYHEIAIRYNVSEIKISRHGMRYGALLFQAGKQPDIRLN